MKNLSRRDFLQLAALSTVGGIGACAVNPVSGRSQLMLVSEDQEIALDRQKSPYQFSEDYGLCQDEALNRYLNETGHRLTTYAHRPRMPYSFRAVNAVYVNAYAFPGGSIAVTRGILLKLSSEAELAALFGHELGHVNARHTAQQMSKGALAQTLGGGVAALAGTVPGAGQIASQLTSLGVGALLASYSRDNEREADSLGLDYMVRAGYTPDGIIGLMEMLNQEAKRQPSALELMFSTHPMSQERLQNARRLIDDRYRQAKGLQAFRERYMDNTVRLRAQKAGIEAIQQSTDAVAKKKLSAAEESLAGALRLLPNDYTALVMMAKVLLLQNKDHQAMDFTAKAKSSSPQEAQAYFVSGIAHLRLKMFAAANEDFTRHQSLLPGNPGTTFFLGLAAEGMNRRPEAARYFAAYLKAVNQGDQAKYAYQRLREWGYMK